MTTVAIVRSTLSAVRDVVASWSKVPLSKDNWELAMELGLPVACHIVVLADGCSLADEFLYLV